MDSHFDSSPPATLVVAYGNPLYGDDGVGWQAAILLARELKDQVQVLARHQLTAELAELISKTDRVFFISAACDGYPGEVRCDPLLDDTCRAVKATHHVAPTDLLVAARECYRHAPLAYVITVTGTIFDYRQALSPTVEAALPNVVSHVAKLVGGDPTL